MDLSVITSGPEVEVTELVVALSAYIYFKCYNNSKRENAF